MNGVKLKIYQRLPDLGTERECKCLKKRYNLLFFMSIFQQ